MNIFFRFFYIFILGSVIGFIIETTWCIIKNKKVESRKGLIYGFFIPIYGVATVLISYFYEILNIRSSMVCFLLIFFICFFVEYLSSYLQEKLLGTKSWDYSKMKFNINGRVNLIYLLIWSALGLLYCKYYNKIILTFASVFSSKRLFNIFTCLFIIFMIYDILISFFATYRQKKRNKGVQARNNIEKYLDNRYDDSYLNKIYANAVRIE